AATVLYAPLKQTEGASRRIAMRVGGLALGLVATTIGVMPCSTTLSEDRADSKSLAAARDALQRHPLDYVSAATIASASTSPPERIAFLNHALRLHPTHSGLHRAVARWLVATKRPTQAALEYRIALEGALDPDALVTEILAKLPTAEAIDAMPRSAANWNRISKLLLDSKRDDIALAWLLHLLDDKLLPSSPTTLKSIFILAERREDLAVASRVVRTLDQVNSDSSLRLRLARLETRKGKLDAALVTIEEILRSSATSQTHFEAELLRCDIHITRPAWPLARDCLIRL
ncbi:MAG: hypothetical protein ABL886_06025, partial [Rhodoglobus sp.]